MFLFVLGIVFGVILGAAFTKQKSQENRNAAIAKEVPVKKQETVIKNDNGKEVVMLHTPIEVLNNLYCLSVERPTVRYVKETFESGKIYEHIRVDCELHYKLNGRKEGKRFFLFSYYDKDGNVISHNETKAYHFTEAGIEFVHTEYYTSWDHLPARIGISVRENA